MALRPKSFFIPSTTELRISFSSELSPKISVSNIKIESLNGGTSDLDVVSTDVTGKQLVVNTKPQVEGNFYLLKLIDTDECPFLSSRGIRLINDDSSRELFFVGIDEVNYVRDRMFNSVPSLFSLENTSLKNILSSQAKEINEAYSAVGELLSDNYISEAVIDEIKVRGPGAGDRLAREGAYEVDRVSASPTGSLARGDSFSFFVDDAIPRSSFVSTDPISLQQIDSGEVEISIDSEAGSFDGFLVSLPDSNLIKLLYLKLVPAGEKEDCFGNIGVEYNIDKHKYGVLDNKYDPRYSFSRPELKSNQVLISDISGFPRPARGDKVVIRYLYKDFSRYIISEEVDVYSLIQSSNEVVPTNSSRFFLNNAPIVDDNNEVFSKNGVAFKVSENSDDVPYEFTKELPFSLSRLPSSPGEYSVNYNTGEVFLADSGEGTGRNYYVCSYTYRNEFLRDLDYVIDDGDLAANSSRGMIGEEVFIDIKYDSMFIPGIDYTAMCQVEVRDEHVGRGTLGSFSVLAKNMQVTDVNRIFNQTTGEVYSYLYSIGNEIFFSGRVPPKVSDLYEESANFERISNEIMEASSEFVSPAFLVTIKASLSGNNIEFYPPIPAEFLDLSGDSYYISEYAAGGEEFLENIHIKFFGNEDSTGRISHLGINTSVKPPSPGTEVYIGVK
jgi:hypothetical protein